MISPQFQALYENIRNQPDRSQMTLEQLRDASEAKAALLPLPADVTQQAVDTGGAAAEWIGTPLAAPEKVLLYFHGGGYYRGSLNTVREMVSRMSRASGARVLNVGYRLAPEHPKTASTLALPFPNTSVEIHKAIPIATKSNHIKSIRYRFSFTASLLCFGRPKLGLQDYPGIYQRYQTP